MRASRRGVGQLIPSAIIAIFLLLLIPSLVRADDPSSPDSPTVQLLTFHTPAIYLNSSFWGVSAHMPVNTTPDHLLSTRMNNTPITFYRYGGGGDNTDQTRNLTYNDRGQAGVLWPQVNDSKFGKWCTWVHNCHTIFVVPGETNDSGMANQTVTYVLGTLGLRPDFWSIGNEPAKWTHFNVPWNNTTTGVHWSIRDNTNATGLQYAQLVQRFIPGMQAHAAPFGVHLKMIGIQNDICAKDSYLLQIPKIDGPNLSAMACHVYPANALNNSNTTAQYYATLSGSHGLPTRVPDARARIAAGCALAVPVCHLPLFVDEFNAQGAAAKSNFMGSYQDAPYIATGIVQAMQLNLSQFMYFTLEDSTNYTMLKPGVSPGPYDIPSWNYYDYSVFAWNLTHSSAIYYNVTVTGNLGLWYAIVGVSQTGHPWNLMIVNTDVASPLTISLQGFGLTAGGSGEWWTWDTQHLTPTDTRGTVVQNSQFTIPAEGIFLLHSN